MYKAIIVRLKDVRPHSNADRLKLATCEGNQVIVGLEAQEGDVGIYFPTDGQLSEQFCKANDLIRRKNPDGTPAGGMFDENRRVRTQKFRGEISDGFWCPISYLSFTVPKDRKLVIDVAMIGTEIDSVGEIPLCNKYISPRTKQHLANVSGKKSKKGSVMFKEHFDTSHFGRNISKIRTGDHIIMTEKVHGTSQRIGHVLVEKETSLWQRICCFLGTGQWITKTEDWEYLTGTRRVVLDTQVKKEGGFHSPSLRELASAPFLGKLHKGETVFYEVVGYEPEGKSIMPRVDIRKLKEQEFINKYAGQTPGSFDMTYCYGCKEGEFKIFVYRITLTNEDGHTVDYSWKDVKRRCTEIGVEHCPELHQEIFKFTEEYLTTRVEQLAKGESILDSNHIREGVCVRVEGGLEPIILKHKSFEFKVLEGITKDTGVLDMEEAS